MITAARLPRRPGRCCARTLPGRHAGARGAAYRRRGADVERRGAQPRATLPGVAAGDCTDGTQVERSRGPDRREVGSAQVRDEAGEPRQQAEIHVHRGRLGAGRRLGRGDAGGAGLPGLVLLLPGLAASRALASPRRAASTPPRTTRTTATASGACSTTRSRAATSARARRTSTGWPRSRVHIIDQCVAQGVPFAREYGGLLANRSFGGAQVSRTFYARGQTGQQLLLGAYQALEKQIARAACRCTRAPRCST